jgi:hypothetical protein
VSHHDGRDDSVGIVFPAADGRRSSLATGRAVFSDAVARVDSALATDLLREPDWRKNYHRHLRTLTHLSARSSVHSSRIARDGLDAIGHRMRFVRNAQEMDLSTAMTVADANRFSAHTVVGDGSRAVAAELTVPYQGQRLSGDSLRRQLDQWVADGITEPGFASALNEVIDHPEWLDLSDLTFVVLGAGAEMAPFGPLIRRGATVAAIDLPRPAIWRRLIQLTHDSPGRLVLPIRSSALGAPLGDEQLARVAGLDLVTDTPEAARWIGALAGPLVLGSYVYAPGADHVRVTTAVDAITKRLTARRHDLTLAFLATPTDAYAVPVDAVEMSQARYAGRSRFAVAWSGLSAGRLFRAQYDGAEVGVEGGSFGISDVLVEQQGPNYALAVRMQRWRALDARVHGIPASVNVAPPTATRSVVRNRLLALAYRGASSFGVEVFQPATSRTLMAALLVHDLRNPASFANPDTELIYDWQLFTKAANHGGLWRSPFEPRSVLSVAVARGALRRN